MIIRSARRIKPAGLFIIEDLAKETMENREDQKRENGLLRLLSLLSESSHSTDINGFKSPLKKHFRRFSVIAINSFHTNVFKY